MTLMIPLSVVMVPAFIVIVGLNLSDNLWGVILSTVSTPTGVFMRRQYMLTIPDDLIEAARVAAASEFRVYWRIVLPLAAPALAVLANFSVIWPWNDFLWPLIVLSSPENYTLQIGLNAFQGQFTVQWHYVIAMTVLALLPVTVAFLFLQRYITEGVSLKKIAAPAFRSAPSVGCRTATPRSPTPRATSAISTAGSGARCSRRSSRSSWLPRSECWSKAAPISCPGPSSRACGGNASAGRWGSSRWSVPATGSTRRRCWHGSAGLTPKAS